MRLLLFIPGVGANGDMHGAALDESPELAASGWVVLRSRANASRWLRLLTLAYSLRGVAAMGRAVLDELDDFLARAPAADMPLTAFAVVGGSFGGLVARFVVSELHAREAWRDVRFALYASLATPHLGVLGLYRAAGALAGWLGASTATHKEGHWADAPEPARCMLARLAGDAELRALGRFDSRLCLAPQQDDGIVCWATASLLGPPGPAGAALAGAHGVVRIGVGGEAAPGALDFIADEAIRAEGERAQAALLGLAWDLVSLDATHRALATLHGGPRARALAGRVIALLLDRLAPASELL